ncbi:hypothetical protein SAMN06272755_3016 [Picosynechococcus sp. OG1]|nr:hypothetical protein SAMN06272755_3016 [Picosynechococcus sp. OG1]SMQ83352.1 hypothetical protein SAMN06272774_2292 [Synechococcus sp. 7002]
MVWTHTQILSQCSRIYCAQRLTASMVWTLCRHCHSCSKCRRAQRLTASMVWTRTPQGHPPEVPLVLNALRHQWFGHFWEWVKNTPQLPMCSTPYGINGLDTPGKKKPTSLPISAQRLTASMVWTLNCEAWFSFSILRAQRLTASMVWTHLIKEQQQHSTPQCSTPYGINGLDTL